MGRPDGRVPTIRIPIASKPSADDSRIDSSTTMTGPGTDKSPEARKLQNGEHRNGEQKRGEVDMPAFLASSVSGARRPSASMDTPVTRPICPTMIEIATPTKKPTRIGRDRRLARLPSRRRLPARQIAPTPSAIAARRQRTVGRGAAGWTRKDGMITPARTAIVAASGPTINRCDGPNSAYPMTEAMLA